MTLHVFANIATGYGIAGNNRGDNEGGNTTTLQKIVWQGESHTTVSAEAIRFAIRRLLAEKEDAGTNRYWLEESRKNEWRDPDFEQWAAGGGFIDDDLLGFMRAEGAKGGATQGTVDVHRAVLEMTRAVSLTPWAGDIVFNAASPGATPSAAKGEGDNPVPYMAEVHATRYQFGLAMTPAALRDPSRAAKGLEAVGELGTVAGNHARFLFDFAPDVIVIRLTEDPAPRILYCFDTDDEAETLGATALLNRIASGDVETDELIVGVSDLDSPITAALKKSGVTEVHGVRNAVRVACERIAAHPDLKGG